MKLIKYYPQFLAIFISVAIPTLLKAEPASDSEVKNRLSKEIQDREECNKNPNGPDGKVKPKCFLPRAPISLDRDRQKQLDDMYKLREQEMLENRDKMAKFETEKSSIACKVKSCKPPLMNSDDELKTGLKSSFDNVGKDAYYKSKAIGKTSGGAYAATAASAAAAPKDPCIGVEKLGTIAMALIIECATR